MTLQRQCGGFLHLHKGKQSDLTVRQAAACRSPSCPFAIVNLALPLAVDVAIDKVGVLTADEQHGEMTTEVL